MMMLMASKRSHSNKNHDDDSDDAGVVVPFPEADVSWSPALPATPRQSPDQGEKNNLSQIIFIGSRISRVLHMLSPCKGWQMIIGDCEW